MNLLVLYCVVSAAINALTSFGLGLYVIATNPRPLASRTFFGFAMSVGLWSFCYAFWHMSGEANQALFWVRGLMAGAIFIPTFFIHFVITLLGIDSGKRRLVRLSYVLSTVFLLSDLTPLFAKEVVQRSVFHFWPVPGPFFHPYLLHFAGSVIYAHYLMYRDLQVSSGSRKNQVKYVALGTLLGFAGGATNFPLWYNLPIPPIGNALVTLYVALTAYAIARYRLLDINIWLARVAIFLLAYVPLLLLPFIGGALLQPALAGWLGPYWWMVPTALEAMVAVLGLSVYRKMTRRAEARILAEQRRYQELLAYAADGMLKVLDLPRLLRLIVGIIVKHVKLTHAVIYLKEEPEGIFRHQVSRGQKVELPEALEADDPLVLYLGVAKAPVVLEELKHLRQEGRATPFSKLSDRLTQMKASVVVPAFFKNHLIGFLILGQKVSQDMFTTDDLATFDALAHQVAIAIQNARFHRKTVDVETVEALGEMVDATGHELGNASYIITILVGTLFRRPGPEAPPLSWEEIEQRGKKVEGNALRLKTVIEDITVYKKLYQQPGIQSFPLRTLIQDAAKLMQKRWEDHPEIKLNLDLPDNLPNIEGHATLHLLPISLLAGSYWALTGPTEQGGTIAVSVRVDPKLNQAVFQVTDTGKSSLLDLIEHPKQMGGGKLFPERSRHGGFYHFSVRRIVQEHNGVFNVTNGSESGQGTALIVRLPLKYTPPPLEEAEEDIVGGSPE